MPDATGGGEGLSTPVGNNPNGEAAREGGAPKTARLRIVGSRGDAAATEESVKEAAAVALAAAEAAANRMEQG